MELLKIEGGGFILSEILLAGAIISLTLSGLIVTMAGMQSMVVDSRNAFEAELMAEEEVISANLKNLNKLSPYLKYEKNYTINFSTLFRNDFSRNISVDVSWLSGTKEKHRLFNTEVIDWQNANQIADCDWLDEVKGDLTALNSAPLNLVANNSITDIAAFGDLIFVSADSASASSSDLIVIDVNDPANPKIIGQINSGPGIAAIVAVKNYIFAANAGSYQFQVFDVSDPVHPQLMVQAKMPDAVISGSAGFGQSIRLFKNRIYLGLTKNNGPEFFAIDVSDPIRPLFLSSFELNSTANDIDTEENKIVVVTPGENSIYFLDVSTQGNISEIFHFSLNGWQTQGARSVEMLGEKIAIGRTLGGFYSPNAELLIRSGGFEPSTSTDLKIGASIDHIFGFENYLYLNTSDPDKALQIIDREHNEVVFVFPFSSRGVSLACNKKGLFVVTQNAQDFFHSFSLPSYAD